ncbi:TNT domain-containing protein [Streptomyces sp. NK08204]|uniref:TNT domain-containing protein n=1 Tax=Streptomyces sp. NK08204 TaxID=2873260 RepID=UPI001CEC8A30|nr:TNT domain-containing protein [Streptomyces sp. NK08204]
MRTPRNIVGSVLLALLLVGVSPAIAQAARAQNGHGAASCPTRHRAVSTTTAPHPQLEAYHDGDWRLGPQVLPRTGPIGRMLRGYHPHDNTSRYWFLGCYWQTNPQKEPAEQVGGWWFPDHHGFLLRDGRPVEHALTLRPGQRIDLFGRGNSGNFLAPEGTPYAERAIPPSNLDEYSASNPPFNYHLYKVIAPFTVEAGPARPWFAQPGLGTQYYTSTNVGDLIAAHKLREITRT